MSSIIQTIKDVKGNSMEIINIQNSVGINGVNSPMDVIVVKALMRMGALERDFNKLTGLYLTTLPSPHNTTVSGLPHAIKKHQKAMRQFPPLKDYKIVVDGRISHAPGTAVKGGVFYTIVGLNVVAKRFSEMMGYKNHTEHFFEIFNSLSNA
jgi:hypothetical protein